MRQMYQNSREIWRLRKDRSKIFSQLSIFPSIEFTDMVLEWYKTGLCSYKKINTSKRFIVIMLSVMFPQRLSVFDKVPKRGSRETGKHGG